MEHRFGKSGEALMRAPGACALLALATALTCQAQAQNRAPEVRFSKMSIELPAGAEQFPKGDGADIANVQCLICHSAAMVLTQPPLTAPQWQAIINKMRSAYGAPMPAEQVDALAAYLSTAIARD